MKAAMMKTNSFFALAVAGTLYTSAWVPADVCADDPLNAFPTAEESTEERVKKLTSAELKAIQLPDERDELVFSIAAGPVPGGEPKLPAENQPWLRVFADGRIDCGNMAQSDADRRTDLLTRSELVWLLHLATNKCQILSRSTTRIGQDFHTADQTPAKPDPKQYNQYHLKLAGAENDLLIPDIAIMLRPLRAKMKLEPFASLHKYASYLVARAWLGDSASRRSLLDQLNEALRAEAPNVPPFQIEHLGAAVSTDKVDLSAVFQQEINLGGNSFTRVTGIVIRKEKDAKPSCYVKTLDYKKNRP